MKTTGIGLEYRVCGDFDMGVRYSCHKRDPSLRNYGREISNRSFHVRRSGACRFRFRDHRTNPRQSRTPAPGTILTVGPDINVYYYSAFFRRAPEQPWCPLSRRRKVSGIQRSSQGMLWDSGRWRAVECSAARNESRESSGALQNLSGVSRGGAPVSDGDAYLGTLWPARSFG